MDFNPILDVSPVKQGKRLFWTLTNRDCGKLMPQTPENNKRIAKNTLLLYVRMLFLMAVLGGGIGGFVGMFTRHHKTKHIDFYVVYGITTVMHILLWFLLWGKIIFV